MLVLSVDESPSDTAVFLYAPVAKEGPPTAHILAVIKVNAYNDAFLFLIGGLVVDFTLWTGDKRGAPELYAIGAPRGVGLESYTIYCHYGQSICHGMSTLHCLPCPALALLFLFTVARLISYGCGIDE